MHYNNTNGEIKLLATDLDGTLLRNDKTISDTDTATLISLGKKGVIRVAATGRSLHKVNDVLSSHTPVDYVVFSSGAGICDWSTGQILHHEQFLPEIAVKICQYLVESAYNFFVFKPIPINNLFSYHRGAGICSEYDNYLGRHTGDFKPLQIESFSGNAGQIMAVVLNNEELIDQLTADIYNACQNVKVIRATSPVNDAYTWLEIFPDTVSKGHGLQWLCQYLNIDRKYTVGIGNDFNDLDMFEFVQYPFLLSNGAEQLKMRFKTISSSNQDDGVSKVLRFFGL